MTREQAYSMWRSLKNMTVARGCTEPEAATAAKMRDRLDQAWGFSGGEQVPPQPEVVNQFWSDLGKAAGNWKWEFRRCGKRNCHCMKGGHPHGPYRYAKQRHGRRVNSIYLGK